MKSRYGVIFLTLSLVFSGCGGESGVPETSDTPPDSGGHAHAAPHGGTLVELGDHEANIEFVFDSAAGKLTVFVLDAHAENPIRLSMESLGIQFAYEESDGVIQGELTAVESALTGETVGDTSEFSAAINALQGREHVDVRIPEITIRGARYTDVTAHLHPIDKP